MKANEGGAGADEVSLAEFERGLGRNLAALSRSLLEQAYVPEPTRTVLIPKPDGRKRKLSIPSVKDRVAQQAVRLVIEPLFENRFLPCSFGYRPGMGPLRAVGRVEALLADGCCWVAVADIEDFFDSLSQAVLLRLVSERIWEKPMLRLIELWLRSGSMYAGDWRKNPEGVPQGGVISPLLSNIYLHPFDAAMTAAQHRLVRYADDFLFLDSDRDRVTRAIHDATEYLAQELFLRTRPAEVLHANEGFVFLGFLFQGGRKSIAPDKLEQMKRRIREATKSGKPLAVELRALNLKLSGWRNYYGVGDVQAQFELLETVLFNELTTRMKTVPADKRRQSRAALVGLEFLLPKTQVERDRFANLLMAAAEGREQTAVHPDTAVPAEPARAVETKRRQYERSAEENSVLLVDRPGSFVGKTSKRVVVKERGRRAREVPLFRLRCIMVASNGVGLSSDLVRFCSGQNVAITFMDERGRPYSYLVGAEHAAHPLTMAQLEAQKSDKGRELARAFVEGKITNQMNLLRYYAKYRGRRESEFGGGIRPAVEKMRQLLEQLSTLSADEHFGGRLFAIEGQAGAVYWGMIRALLASDACFERREKQGATDIVNSLLNYGYGVLYGLMHRLIILAGLNPNVGFIHRDQTGRPSLLFDVVEEFRQPVVDRAVIKLLRKKARLGMNGTLLDQPTRRRLVTAVMDNLGSPVYYCAGRTSLRMAMEGQVKRLVACLKGEGHYRPFIFH